MPDLKPGVVPTKRSAEFRQRAFDLVAAGGQAELDGSESTTRYNCAYGNRWKDCTNRCRIVDIECLVQQIQ